MSDVGCKVCLNPHYDEDSPYPRGGTGTPGLVHLEEKVYGHVPRGTATREQAAVARVCNTGHVDCLYTVVETIEVVGPCVCNEGWVHPSIRKKYKEGSLQERERIVKETMGHSPRAPYAD